jgi:hypothetical protein
MGLLGATMGQGSANLDESLRQLRNSGRKIVTAVLNHDIETILMYDRPDLRSEDRLSLRDTKSDLYCFLFDRSCNAAGHPSVYDILSSAKQPDIEVQMLRVGGSEPYGLILFFDATRITRAKLQSASYLCQQSGQMVSWMFKLEGKGWVSAHGPFDAETDTLCSPR